VPWTWKANIVLGVCGMIMFTVARATGNLGNAHQILVGSLTYMTAGMATKSRRVVALLHQLPSSLGFALLHGVPTLMTSVCCFALMPQEWMEGRRAILPPLDDSGICFVFDILFFYGLHFIGCSLAWYSANMCHQMDPDALDSRH